MQFTCDRESLVHAVSLVERAVATRDAMFLLTGILLEAQEGRLKLVATDLELGIESAVPAETERPGAVVVDGRLLGQLVRKLPGEKVQLALGEGEGLAVVRSGRAEFSLHIRPANDFPPLPDKPAQDRWRVQQRLLRDMIRQTAFAAAADETRPYLTGVLFEVEGQELRLVATDSNRLAFRKGVLAEPAAAPRQAIVPARTAHEVARILHAEGDATVDIAVADSHIAFETGEARVVSRLLEGTYPNYRQVLPQEQPIRTRVDRNVLQAAVERAALLSRKGPAVVIVNVADSTLTISAREADVGRSQEEIEVAHEGEAGQNAYQARFLLDVLRVVDTDEVQFDFTEGDKPATVKPVNGEDYVCLIMPIRLG
ncbi:MAG: DNA polymerase III subunit beta [Limnochordales bacterium]|nr:DNA polymerase III subunit beta [Limnochordales bacterium]